MTALHKLTQHTIKKIMQTVQRHALGSSHYPLKKLAPDCLMLIKGQATLFTWVAVDSSVIQLDPSGNYNGQKTLTLLPLGYCFA